MEKAMKAQMTIPPTVPPTMRMVLVLTPPLEVVELELSAEEFADVGVADGVE